MKRSCYRVDSESMCIKVCLCLVSMFPEEGCIDSRVRNIYATETLAVSLKQLLRVGIRIRIIISLSI